MSEPPLPLFTAEQYLEIERNAQRKSEFYNGEMFAMPTARFAHNELARNMLIVIGNRRGSYRSCPSDMRVLIPATGLYTYPDVVVVCGQPEFLDETKDTLLNPGLIMEVLSPSTESFDRSRKFEQYRSIPSFSEYLLVSSDRVHVDLYQKQPDGKWLLSSAGTMEESLTLATIGCPLPLSELYYGVDLS
ncbi:MAG TPA: Uma2 family endonuclease [Bryobacteraceae bacterium]|jgi:Uma2 family endonuclease